MHQASTINPHLPNIFQPDPWEVSISNLYGPSRIRRNSGEIRSNSEGHSKG
jgi:hypothetical protein